MTKEEYDKLPNKYDLNSDIAAIEEYFSKGPVPRDKVQKDFSTELFHKLVKTGTIELEIIDKDNYTAFQEIVLENTLAKIRKKEKLIMNLREELHCQEIMLSMRMKNGTGYVYKGGLAHVLDLA